MSSAPAVGLDGAHALPRHHHDFARLHLPDESCSHAVQRAAFGSEHHRAVGGFSHAQRPETLRIPGGDQLLRRHDHQGIRPPDPVHGFLHRLLDGAGAQPRLGDGVGDDLRVAGTVENRALQLEFPTQLQGVGQITVMSQSHGSFHMAHHQRLGVADVDVAGCGIPDMPHGDTSPAQLFQHLSGEHLWHQPHRPVRAENPILVDGDATALLSPVLQRVKGEIGGLGHVGNDGIIYAENAAFLMNRINHAHSSLYHQNYRISEPLIPCRSSSRCKPCPDLCRWRPASPSGSDTAGW